MTDTWDEEELWDDLAEDEEVTEEEEEELEEFIEEVYEIGDLADDYDGPTCVLTISAGGDEYEIRIPAEYVPDIIDLAGEMDIDIEIDSE